MALPDIALVDDAGKPFTRDARRALADAILQAEATDGQLRLVRWEPNSKTRDVVDQERLADIFYAL